ncbi:hypothetical protein VTK73DRAFT_54 [Phialemonium thermophilum]|uniref:RNase III domain-containing protein n=1 Tax=Phialemonium thermophilum TaxID=223376 RepID=A0ABR3Y8V5_9PEZI
MAKRIRDDLADISAERLSGTFKRKRAASSRLNGVGDALDVLLESADTLFRSLDAVRYHRTRGSADPGFLDRETRTTLTDLCRKLCPALQLLSHELEEEGNDGAAVEGDDTASESKNSFQSVDVREIPFSIPQTAFSSWKVSDSLVPTPALPPILDPDVESTAFRHSGAAKKPGQENYERLEWIGDACLFLIASGFIYQTFKSYPPGKCTQLRELLVCNSTLATYSRRYGLDKRANLPAEFAEETRPGASKVSDKERNKVLGDLFEAYIGAVVTTDPEQGFSRVSAWLKGLWAETMWQKVRDEEKGKAAASWLAQMSHAMGVGVSKLRAPELSAKVELAKLLQVPGVKLRYEDIPGRDKRDRDNDKRSLFTVGVFLDGWGESNKQLGWGTALSKKDAGEKAARMALENPKLMKLYATKKKEYLAARGK